MAPGEQTQGTLTPTLSQGKRESYGEVVLVGRLREVLSRLNTAISQSRTLANLRDPARPGLPKQRSGALSLADEAAEWTENTQNRTKLSE